MLDDLKTIGGSLAGLGRASNRILSLGTLGTCFTFTSLGIRGGPSGLARRLLDWAIRGAGRYRTYSRPYDGLYGRKMKRWIRWLEFDKLDVKHI